LPSIAFERRAKRTAKRTAYNDSVDWLGNAPKEKILATYQGRYFAICKKCPHGLNKKSKIGKYAQYRKNKDFVIQLSANQINNFKKKHDSEGHNWTILHESIVPKYVSRQMIGDKECLVITV